MTKCPKALYTSVVFSKVLSISFWELFNKLKSIVFTHKNLLTIIYPWESYLAEQFRQITHYLAEHLIQKNDILFNEKFLTL